MRISDWSSDVCSSDLRKTVRPVVELDLLPQELRLRLERPVGRERQRIARLERGGPSLAVDVDRFARAGRGLALEPAVHDDGVDIPAARSDERRIAGKARPLDVDLADGQVVPAERAAADGAVGRRSPDKGAEADIRAALLAETGEILADLKARKIAVERRGDVAVPFDLAILGEDAAPGRGQRAAAAA